MLEGGGVRCLLILLRIDKGLLFTFEEWHRAWELLCRGFTTMESELVIYGKSECRAAHVVLP